MWSTLNRKRFYSTNIELWINSNQEGPQTKRLQFSLVAEKWHTRLNLKVKFHFYYMSACNRLLLEQLEVGDMEQIPHNGV